MSKKKSLWKRFWKWFDSDMPHEIYGGRNRRSDLPHPSTRPEPSAPPPPPAPYLVHSEAELDAAITAASIVSGRAERVRCVKCVESFADRINHDVLVELVCSITLIKVKEGEEGIQ